MNMKKEKHLSDGEQHSEECGQPEEWSGAEETSPKMVQGNKPIQGYIFFINVSFAKCLANKDIWSLWSNWSNLKKKIRFSTSLTVNYYT